VGEFIVASVSAFIVLLIAGWVRKQNYNPAASSQQIPAGKESFLTDVSPAEVIKAVARYAKDYKYKIDHVDSDHNVISLRRHNDTFNDTELFVITASNANPRTCVEISIVSSWSLVRDINFQKCITNVKTMVASL
jgi:hypothetical protein